MFFSLNICEIGIHSISKISNKNSYTLIIYGIRFPKLKERIKRWIFLNYMWCVMTF